MQPIITELEVLGITPFGKNAPATRFFALRLSHPGWSDFRPGQFIMLRAATFGLELTWARPFSICHMTARHLICFMRVSGKGTARMAKLAPGDKITAWGPLGNGFVMEQNTPTLLLAGGMGIAPFVGYVARHPQPWNLAMLFGHRDPIDCYPVDSINEHITVDSLRETVAGELDNFIYTMQERLQDCAAQNGLALACGPAPFLRAVKNLAAKYNCRLQISMENRMACGVGACLGCVCQPAANPSQTELQLMPVRTCVHGPVFWANEVEV